jgi:hypothetical protein
LVRLGDVRAVVLGLRSVPKAWWNAAAVASATMTVLCVMARFSGRVNVRLETTQVWGATAAAFGFLGIAASAVIGRWSELLGSLGVAGSLGSLAIVWWMLGENRLQGARRAVGLTEPRCAFGRHGRSAARAAGRGGARAGCSPLAPRQDGPIVRYAERR